jgi:hypothetical protein
VWGAGGRAVFVPSLLLLTPPPPPVCALVVSPGLASLHRTRCPLLSVTTTCSPQLSCPPFCHLALVPGQLGGFSEHLCVHHDHFCVAAVVCLGVVCVCMWARLLCCCHLGSYLPPTTTTTISLPPLPPSLDPASSHTCMMCVLAGGVRGCEGASVLQGFPLPVCVLLPRIV